MRGCSRKASPGQHVQAEQGQQMAWAARFVSGETPLFAQPASPPNTARPKHSWTVHSLSRWLLCRACRARIASKHPSLLTMAARRSRSISSKMRSRWVPLSYTAVACLPWPLCAGPPNSFPDVKASLQLRTQAVEQFLVDRAALPIENSLGVCTSAPLPPVCSSHQA